MRFLNYSYNGHHPQIGAGLRAAPDAAVLGRAILGENAVLGACSVIRADGHKIEVGRNFSLGPQATVHIAHETIFTQIGDDVAVGADAVIHACTLGDGCVIGAGCVILDGSVLGAGIVLAPGSVAFPRSQLEPGMLYAGAPAKPVRPLEPGELEASRTSLRAQNDMSLSVAQAQGDHSGLAGQTIFTAANAQILGEVQAADQTGIWFGCILDGRDAPIRLGARTNVQDNARLTSDAGALEIGADVTIGHNVVMSSCQIGAGSLIGIGARVAPGTVVEPNTMLAAGAATEPGQVLTSGQLWAGVPARPKRQLSESQTATLSVTIPAYIEYGQNFAAAQAAAQDQAQT